MSITIFPCPHCGQQPIERAIEPHTHGLQLGDWKMPDHEGSHVIECACGAGMIDETRAAVAARWNQREGTGIPQPPSMSSAVAHLMRRMQQDGRLAYLIGPGSESYDLLTQEAALAAERNVDEFRKGFEATLRPTPWPSEGEILDRIEAAMLRAREGGAA